MKRNAGRQRPTKEPADDDRCIAAGQGFTLKHPRPAASRPVLYCLLHMKHIKHNLHMTHIIHIKHNLHTIHNLHNLHIIHI